MKYKLIIFFFILSCANYSTNFEKKTGFSASGFAYIEKNVPSNLIKDKFFISHNRLRSGTKIRIINPYNKKSLEITIKKKIKYDNFYKILISENIADKLELSSEFPFVEINEIKSNKSFVAKKAITQIAEKKIANKAPIDLININNISKKKILIKRKSKKYSILVADFYSISSAKSLKEKLGNILKTSNYKLIYINKMSKNNYQLFMGPYNTINKLKNDYTVLSDSGFEDLDIKIND